MFEIVGVCPLSAIESKLVWVFLRLGVGDVSIRVWSAMIRRTHFTKDSCVCRSEQGNGD